MSSGAYPAASGGNNGGGAFWPRPRGRMMVAAALLVVVAVTVITLVVTGGSGGGAAHRAANSRYGSYPAWLPHTKLPPVNTILKASPSHPQLHAVEGNTMQVQLPGGAEADITAVGPAFPAWVTAAAQAGTLSAGSAVPTTFTVTVIARAGTVPLRAAAFSFLTAGGQLLHPAVTDGGKAVPPELRAGQHANLTLSAKLVEGDGSLRWAPSGARVLSGWLYQLELD